MSLEDFENIVFWHSLDAEGFLTMSKEPRWQDVIKALNLDDDVIKEMWIQSEKWIRDWVGEQWGTLPDTFIKVTILSHACGLLRGMGAKYDRT